VPTRKPPPRKDGAGRRVLATRHDLTHCYTLECNFNSGRRDARLRFGPANWAEVGRGCLLALRDLAPESRHGHGEATPRVAAAAAAAVAAAAAAKVDPAQRRRSSSSKAGGGRGGGRGGLQQAMKEARMRMRKEQRAAAAVSAATDGAALVAEAGAEQMAHLPVIAATSEPEASGAARV
jgi:hypothetical protein